MRPHRAFVLDDAEHIFRRHDFEAKADAQAIELAEKFVDGHNIEVWELRRVVARLKAR